VLGKLDAPRFGSHTLLAAPETAEKAEKAEKASKKGIDMEQYEDFMDVLIFLLRDFLVFKATGDDSHLIFSDKVSYIRSATKTCTYEGIGSMIKDMEIAQNRVNSNVNIDLALELMLLGMKENL
jgi:DNA polymerase-3 subunit delta'